MSNDKKMTSEDHNSWPPLPRDHENPVKANQNELPATGESKFWRFTLALMAGALGYPPLLILMAFASTYTRPSWDWLGWLIGISVHLLPILEITIVFLLLNPTQKRNIWAVVIGSSISCLVVSILTRFIPTLSIG